jgi:hypothetical protein
VRPIALLFAAAMSFFVSFAAIRKGNYRAKNEEFSKRHRK